MPAANVQRGSATTAPRPTPTARRLIVTWQHPVTRSIDPVAVLYFDGSRYGFNYIEGAREVADFRPFLGFPDLSRTYESDHLFALFAQRAMAPRRPDYTQWITRLGLEDDATPFEQIARSGGRREGDTIQLFPEPRLDSGVLKCSFLVHGIRHVPDRDLTVNGEVRSIDRSALDAELSRLRVGDELRLCDESDNSSNRNAILTTTLEGIPLGWVPNLLVDDLHRLPDRNSIEVSVQHVNGPDAGWHLRLLAWLTAVVPDDYRILSDQKWLPYGAAGS